MARYKIIIEYDGSNYVGWQRQPKHISIQGKIEEGFSNLSKDKITIFASGRTDAGVHALKQVAHFDLETRLTSFQIMMSLNDYLKKEGIAIVHCEEIREDFHSRFDAKMRHYQYRILNRRAKATIDKNRVWQIPFELDLEEMKKASKYLIGKHDFTSFRDSQCQAQDPIRAIKKITITKEGDLILLDFSALSFLHHMVRNIVGTLVMAGGGKINADEMKNILEAKDRTKSGKNAPPWGLYFVGVDY